MRHDQAVDRPDAEVLGHLQAFADVGFWEHDLRTGRLYLSTQVFQILGIAEATVEAYLDVVHPDDLSLLREVHARARTQPGPYRVRHRTRDGERLLQIRVQSVGDETGTPVRYMGVISDVTAEWRLEQALELSTSARLTGLLAGSAVHDLKNVFAVLLGHANLALRAVEHGAPPDPESLAALTRAAERGLQLTTDLLQVGSGMPLVGRRVAIAELFRRVEVTATTVLGRHRRLDVRVSEGDVDVIADGPRLERAIVDLLLNARDALPDSDGAVWLSFQPVDEADVPALTEDHGLPPGTYGAIEVRDDGGGIPPEVIARVTDPFFTTKAGAGGSGVGLHTVARFVESAGGALAIDSELGVGTSVRLILPTRPSVARSNRGRRTIRVAIRGDDPHRLDLLGERLGAAGLQVVPTTTTAAALRLLRTEPIDLLVVDGTSPGDDLLLRTAGATSTAVLGVAELLGAGRPLDDDGLRTVVDAVDALLERSVVD